ncbi:MAG: helix-turn-helix transcriptional regulator [Betaproteobacteria bacterium]|uniref:Helix-turn-helix transcriptional regulator n=1 Tax=Candidatus Proximibacter danicus TaxID=2954365 RepID=A0A9D7K243_9PROT|nr:helix-turn-helix transcriptional regulator [Candidatus Proximibacter danicus]
MAQESFSGVAVRSGALPFWGGGRPGPRAGAEKKNAAHTIKQIFGHRARAGLTQDAVAERMGTTKSAISRLESSGKHAPSLATLKRYAEAVGCDLQVKLVPHKAA